MKVLIVHDRLEQKQARTRDKKHYFDRVVINHTDQLRYLEGLMFREVWVTAKVMIAGIDIDIFDRCVSTLVRMSVDPSYAFQIFYIGKEIEDDRSESPVLPPV